MAIHNPDALDQSQLQRRRVPEPSSITARTAGLYSEVVWDRDWSRPASPNGALAREVDLVPAPTGQPPA